ncbi:MAG: 50S ribosomal protein L20 [Candidatus Pacebacteria bacterium]|nr:50S ribosomal protein L20 [Candidatus Paceibacterota bacterium]
MTRVKRGKTATKKRNKILKYTKGFRWDRKSKERAAKEALLHAWTHAFQGRKVEKRVMRSLWQTKINAATRLNGMTYGNFIFKTKKHKIEIDRKILADIAEHHPEAFKKIVESVKA